MIMIGPVHNPTGETRLTGKPCKEMPFASLGLWESLICGRTRNAMCDLPFGSTVAASMTDSTRSASLGVRRRLEHRWQLNLLPRDGGGDGDDCSTTRTVGTPVAPDRGSGRNHVRAPAGCRIRLHHGSTFAAD